MYSATCTCTRLELGERRDEFVAQLREQRLKSARRQQRQPGVDPVVWRRAVDSWLPRRELEREPRHHLDTYEYERK